MKDFLEFINEKAEKCSCGKDNCECGDKCECEEGKCTCNEQKVNESQANYDAVSAFRQTEEYERLSNDYRVLKETLETLFEDFLENNPEFGLDPGDSDFDQSIDVIMGEFDMY